MASVSSVVRTCGLLFYLILNVCSEDGNENNPWIVQLEVDRKHCVELMCKYLLHVRGGPFLGHYSWRLTAIESSKGSDCGESYPNYEIKEIESKEWDTRIEITVPNLDGKLFFCLHYPLKKNSPFRGKYVHQGAGLFLDPKNDVVSKDGGKSYPNEKSVQRNQGDVQVAEVQNAKTNWVDLSHDIDVNYLPNKPRSTRVERADVEVLFNDNFIPLNEIENSFQYYTPYQQRSSLNPENRIESVIEKNRNKREIIHSVDKEEDQELENLEELKMGNDEVIGPFDDKIDKVRVKTDDEMLRNERQAGEKVEEFSSVRADHIPIVIEGLRIEDSDKEPKIIEEGIPSVLAESKFTLRLFGQGLTQRTVIAFTHDPMEYGQPCKFLVKGEYMVKENTLKTNTALFEIIAPSPITGSKLYICAKNLKFGITDPNKDEEKYLHMGVDNWRVFATHNKLLPLWVSLTLILVCLMFSALFSGLNLGLMSLDRTELKIISNTGTEQERKYARAIMPVRDHGNYLLCSILLGNVAVNSTFTILLDELTSGLFAVIFSTLAIVLLGEITPQAICSRHGLMVGAKSIMITKAVMALTAPLAFPVSKLLDYFLGEEIGSVYNRERLKELVKVTTDVNDLDKDEVNIISGALELRKKTVSDVMTKLEDAFMLPITSVLDFETMSEIVKSGYSRIPVYEGSRGNIITVLFIKDLAFVDPDDNTPLKTLCQYYQNPCNFVFEDVTLDVMFKQFKEGHKGHMAFVHRINNEGEGDPFYETIGLVTLEDVIEEMIQAEIVDETDVFMDNRTKRRRNRPQNKLQDFAAFAERHENQRIHISPQLTLATFQFLSTSVDAFRPDTVSETVLRRLLKQDVIQHIKVKNKTKRDPCTYVFQQGKSVDYFVLILEGRVEVTVGRENLVFEAGPFTYFGVQALTQNIGVAESPTPSAMGSLQNINMDSMLRHTFVPDYSVRAITELYYLTVKRSLYLAAKRATLMEKGALSKGATNEQFDTEVDKLNPKTNIIELMQVTNSNYASTDNVSDRRLLNNQIGERLAKSVEPLSNANQFHANTSAKIEHWPNATKSVSNLLESSVHSTNDEVSCCSNDYVNYLDASNCDECLRNNFWMKTVTDGSCKLYG
ncbi:unextended protein-like [Battus philenor]|uniref:unextended protein-like n=1 Tax=Battus philenor TaxID=42288 RepID=UPI0035CF69D4